MSTTASDVTSALPGRRKRKATTEGARGDGEKTGSSSSKQACVACRQRKIRCNADKPACAYCKSKKQDCVYGPLFRRAQCDQSHVDALEAKVKELEQANGDNRTRTLNEYSPVPSQTERSHDVSETTQYSSAGPRPPQSARNFDSGRSSIAAEKDSTLSSPSSPPSRESRKLYNKSSSLHFALNVKASAKAMAPGNNLEPDGSKRLSASSFPVTGLDAQSTSSHADDAEDADDDEEDDTVSYTGPFPAKSQLLPHRHLAKTLFAKYFEAVHPIWPFLLENETRELFSQTWTSEEPPEPLWLVHLNLIMCLGCQHYEEDGNGYLFQGCDAIGLGKDFYQRAQEYVYANAFTTSSIGMVQALLLIAQYQQGAMQFREFYLTIGHTARMAQSLGLHISRPEAATILPQHRELRRRLWWGCFCLDRISSMLYGRPTGIPYGEFSEYQDLLPREVDDEHISRGHEQPVETPSMNSFFRHSVRLYHVMDDVLLRLRNAKTTAYFDIQKASSGVRINRPVSNVNAIISLLNTILQLDGHLLSWHEYLPPHLQFSLHSVVPQNLETPLWIQRQVHQLRSRFLGMRILLHRQTVLFLLQPPERLNWPQNGIQEWPPLFSDCNSDTLVGGSTPFRRQGTPSPVETTLTHLSANICVSSAILQIEAIDRQLSSKLKGEWWWDLNATFNALCILYGALAFHSQDLSVVVPDLLLVHDIVRRGLGIIQRIASIGGLKAQQSKRFLQKLIRATLRRYEKDKSTNNLTSSNPSSSHPTNSPAQSMRPTTATHNPNASPPIGNSIRYSQNWPNLNIISGLSTPQPTSVPATTFPPAEAPTTNNVDDLQAPSILNWSLLDAPLLSTGETSGLDPGLGGMGSDPSSTTMFDGDGFEFEGEDSIQTLFNNSFDIWGALDDQDGGVESMRF